jgi:cupin fold WbuC family metalloprotein
MELEQINAEVLVARSDITVIGPDELARIKAMAASNARGIARICAHPNDDDPLHEMLLAMRPGRYVRPHAHSGKSESFHLIEGALTVVVFDDEGEIAQLVDLCAGAGPAYYRLAKPRFHTVLPQTDMVVFHETTNGPFRRADTLFPGWAPSDADAAAGHDYLARLLPRIEAFRRSAGSGRQRQDLTP